MVVIEGVVTHGRELGQSIGFPTANISIPADLEVKNGVYMSCVEVDGVVYKSMSNLGCSPSIGGTERRLETHIFDFGDSLYGKVIRVELLRKIRDEQKFNSIDALVEQIKRDKEIILKLNK